MGAAVSRNDGGPLCEFRGRKSMKTLAYGLAGLALLALQASPAVSEVINLKADLNAAQETPPNDSTGTGVLTGTFDTTADKMCWSVSFGGLTGTAISAHFHGPAPVGKDASVLLAATGWGKSPIEGCARPTELFVKYLNEGNIYFNIHTFAHKAGEIRGQVLRSR
jgi:hypothetical protein